MKCLQYVNFLSCIYRQILNTGNCCLLQIGQNIRVIWSFPLLKAGADFGHLQILDMGGRSNLKRGFRRMKKKYWNIKKNALI